MIIRTATTSDAQALLAIYAPYIEHTAITFEYDVPTVEAFAHRIEEVLHYYPWLIAEDGGVVLGYAYAHRFHERAACRWSAESSIYLSQSSRGRGIGHALQQALERELVERGIKNLYVSIAYTDEADEHLPVGSIPFHEHEGFKKVAHFHKCGVKFGRWYDLIWMEKMLGEHE